jgi:hypothetical protein
MRRDFFLESEKASPSSGPDISASINHEAAVVDWGVSFSAGDPIHVRG